MGPIGPWGSFGPSPRVPRGVCFECPLGHLDIDPGRDTWHPYGFSRVAGFWTPFYTQGLQRGVFLAPSCGPQKRGGAPMRPIGEGVVPPKVGWGKGASICLPIPLPNSEL